MSFSFGIKIFIMKKNLYSLSILLMCLVALPLESTQAQCTQWLNPTDSTGWTDFNSDFGGAPCADSTGCPFYEINLFEVWASEAYSIDNFIEGGMYAFSMCNGAGAGSWVPEFTIISPSGIIDAFGPGDGDSCTITWTASESGTYLIVINEAGECGGGPNTNTDNGFPAITCLGNANCATTCEAGTLTTTGSISLCSDDATFDVEATGVEIPSNGQHGWLFDNNTGGTGALDGPFILLNTADTATYNSDLNGILSSNGLPVFAGRWVVKSVTYSDPSDAFGTVCSVSNDSLVVAFASEGPTIDMVQNNSDGSATVVVSGGLPPYSYLWSDPDMQTDSTAVNLDADTYTVTVTDANGCTATGSTTVTATYRIEELKELTLLPNPTSGIFQVQLTLTTPQPVRIHVLDITGRQVYRSEVQSGSSNFEFDMSTHPPGVYLLKIAIGNEILTRRLVVAPQ